jgi:hypothetical protein
VPLRGTFLDAVHVAPPSDDSSAQMRVVPPLLLMPATSWTSIPSIEVTVPGRPKV